MRFGTDGVRGVANTELTPEFVLRLGRAAARVLGASVAVVGGDTRRSTAMLDAALVAGLASEGVDVVRLGVVPTPAVAHHAALMGAMGAMVSASHNPHHDNGIKLFAVGGTKLPDAVERQIEAALDELGADDGTGGPTGAGVEVEPGAVTDASAGGQHHTFLTGYLDHVLDALEGRSLAGVRVVVDAANGAASESAGELFRRAGAEVVVIHADPDGRNINASCGATHTTSLAQAVVDQGAHLGLALDGDADRLIAVDEHGERRGAGDVAQVLDGLGVVRVSPDPGGEAARSGEVVDQADRDRIVHRGEHVGDVEVATGDLDGGGTRDAHDEIG